MADDLLQKRKERLSPQAQKLYDDIMAAGVAGGAPEGPKFDALAERMEEVDPSERAEFMALLGATSLGAQRFLQENQETVEHIRGVENIFQAAHNKLRAEGKPIDPSMTFREACEVLSPT